MPRPAFKPDSSFFRKIVMGAVGTRAIRSDLEQYGHSIVELERGSLDTKIWKDVKRKRVRLPDLVCTKCGQRIESRAKTKTELAMSHSPTEDTRAWDFGLVDGDYVAFPVCEVIEEQNWSSGILKAEASYWQEKNWVEWQQKGCINYFLVRDFRSSPPSKSSTKGVTEGSETSISWSAKFSSRDGIVSSIIDRKVKIQRDSDGHCYTWRIPEELEIWVSTGESVRNGQILASRVQPLGAEQLNCSENISDHHLSQLLSSRERTQRFTGVKLARLRQERELAERIFELSQDGEEDIYIRLEGASYLASVCGQPVNHLFRSYLEHPDDQTKLEAVITLGETKTDEASELLAEILNDEERPYFLRSAACWSLSQIGNERAINYLVQAFSQIHPELRSEALQGIVSLEDKTASILLEGLRENDQDIVAGCAEALRQQQPLPEDILATIVEEINANEPSTWLVWLFGNLPRDQVASRIAALQNTAPQIHYAVSLLWAFRESWISRHWEVHPTHKP